MPTLVYEIIALLASLLRLLGLLVAGAGIGWLTVDLLGKSSLWPAQVVIFLGLLGIVIALTCFTAAGALGAFCLGLGIAIFVWGRPKKEKPAESE